MPQPINAAGTQVPNLKDLTIENITDNVHLINSGCENKRLKYVLERAVHHLHEFARETRLSTSEWMSGIEFLTAVGQICSPTRQVTIPSFHTHFQNTNTRPRSSSYSLMC